VEKWGFADILRKGRTSGKMGFFNKYYKREGKWKNTEFSDTIKKEDMDNLAVVENSVKISDFTRMADTKIVEYSGKRIP